ncbi:MAG: glycerophosphodiester phosphodiesterase family protein, partial [Caldimonas sp.]
ASLAAAMLAVPELPRALLLGALNPGWLQLSRALGCVAVVTAYALIDVDVLMQTRGAGMRALVYTVNDPAEAERLTLLGIDGIITDAVDRFSPAICTSS